MSFWKCQVCGQAVAHGGIGFNYKIWHNKCFRCTDCDLALNSYNYRVRDGKPFCLAHYSSDSTADDRGSFVMLPLAGMKRVLSDFRGAMETVMNDLVFPVLPFGMNQPRKQSDGGIMHTPMFQPPEHLTLDVKSNADQETIPSGSQQGATANPKPESNQKNRVIVSISAAGDKTMELAKGSICEEQVDVIVNSIGTSLNITTGALTKAILQAAGTDIKTELEKMGGEPPVQSGSIIATKGYKLPCKHVLHAILNSWSESEQCVQNLRQLINQILLKADELSARSIAFPMLGTGVLGYPKDTVALVLYLEVTNYLENNLGSSLQKVVFAVPQDQEHLIKILRDLLIGDIRSRNVPLEPSVEEDPVTVEDTDEELGYFRALMAQFTKTRRGKNGPKSVQLLPAWWLTSVGSRQPYAKYELRTSDREYKGIVLLMNNRDGKDFTKYIFKIERIENQFLWSVYSAMKKAMVNTNADGTENERRLWHGTQLLALESIIASGFNRCYSERAVYGTGVYFAHNFSYSARDSFSPSDYEGRKYVFLCRVLTGCYFQGSPDIREPPINDDTQLPFDSAVDSIVSPKIFVTFRDYMMYPEYLITLLRK